MTVRVFLVEDHPMFREGVRHALEGAEGIQLLGEAASAADALGQLRALDPGPDVVLMDLRLGGESGIDVTRSITGGAGRSDDTGRSDRAAGPADAGETAPQAATPRVLVMSASEEDDCVVAAIRAGARGYLVKGASREELCRAITTVATGAAVFSPSVALRLGGYFEAMRQGGSGRVAFPDLTEREREVLDLVARGWSNHRIARELTLAEKTVRNHVSRVLRKLEVERRAEAMVRARSAGLGE
ncbi:response regulator transcription factor [Kitasatospora camelliae]|uniref:Response regulator transcription factor n=1 Tax=Kitasatospora camelliae TaxID=3156397 RepID=A0AAU8K1R2_9ACTN